LVKIDGEGKRKLSKRKDPEADVQYYFQEGFLPEAIIEFLANLANA
jgi:glutamyl-tRNA synthetase